ncbi:hemolysin III family protein [Streptomyces albidoflavus]
MTAENTRPAARSRDRRYPSDARRGPAAGARPGAPTPPSGGEPEDALERAAAVLKPRMRGWLHAGVFPLALAGGIVLITLARSAAAVAAFSVYALSACLLFGTSALYHRGTWGPRGEAVAGGLLYTAGATVYGLKRPDPWPRWFGFHEVFHTLTIAAFASHYAAILLGAT